MDHPKEEPASGASLNEIFSSLLGFGPHTLPLPPPPQRLEAEIARSSSLPLRPLKPNELWSPLVHLPLPPGVQPPLSPLDPRVLSAPPSAIPELMAPNSLRNKRLAMAKGAKKKHALNVDHVSTDATAGKVPGRSAVGNGKDEASDDDDSWDPDSLEFDDQPTSGPAPRPVPEDSILLTRSTTVTYSEPTVIPGLTLLGNYGHGPRSDGTAPNTVLTTLFARGDRLIEGGNVDLLLTPTRQTISHIAPLNPASNVAEASRRSSTDETTSQNAKAEEGPSSGDWRAQTSPSSTTTGSARGDMLFAESQEEMRISKVAEEIKAVFDGFVPGDLVRRPIGSAQVPRFNFPIPHPACDCARCGRHGAQHPESPSANGSSPSVAPGKTSNNTQQPQTKQVPSSVPTPAEHAAATGNTNQSHQHQAQRVAASGYTPAKPAAKTGNTANPQQQPQGQRTPASGPAPAMPLAATGNTANQQHPQAQRAPASAPTPAISAATTGNTANQQQRPPQGGAAFGPTPARRATTTGSNANQRLQSQAQRLQAQAQRLFGSGNAPGRARATQQQGAQRGVHPSNSQQRPETSDAPLAQTRVPVNSQPEQSQPKQRLYLFPSFVLFLPSLT
jgi:hypothetical protein